MLKENVKAKVIVIDFENKKGWKIEEPLRILKVHEVIYSD